MNVADKAREALAKVRPGSLEGRRTLPIRAHADEIQRQWADERVRAAALEELPVDEASLEVGEPVGDWGTATTIKLKLKAPVGDVGTGVLAGKAVRRLKALVETGEAPTTAHNPAARDDAGAS